MQTRNWIGLATAVGAGTPKVTVCMPVFNGSEYIAEAIESVLAQTYRDFQLIVSDNCSSDDTGAIVQRFDDPRIRYSKNATNLGLIGNMNRCLELATGDYLCIFHHDDVMLPENLARKVQVLDEEKREERQERAPEEPAAPGPQTVEQVTDAGIRQVAG
jgi:glycosyltransferase involved in cell wall biosynthesis